MARKLTKERKARIARLGFGKDVVQASNGMVQVLAEKLDEIESKREKRSEQRG